MTKHEQRRTSGFIIVFSMDCTAPHPGEGKRVREVLLLAVSCYENRNCPPSCSSIELDKDLTLLNIQNVIKENTKIFSAVTFKKFERSAKIKST